jgi:hypothetical protein
MDKNKTTAYWLEVIRRAFKPVWDEMTMRVLILAIIVLLFVVGVSGILLTLGLIPNTFFENRVAEAWAGITAFGVSIAVFAILFIIGIYKVPAEMHYEQQKIIDSFPPDKLNIFVGSSPFKGWLVEDDVDIHTAYLKVISREKKKIVEFHARRIEFLQRTADMKPDIRGAMFGAGLNNVRFEWENGEVFTEMIPGDAADILIGKLDPRIGYPIFGQSETAAPNGARPSIYEVYIQFKGKREGETDFAYYNYRTELYCHPEYNILDFAEYADDIPRDLKPKVLFTNKEQDEQEN